MGRSVGDVVGRRVVFGVIVRHVGGAAIPVETKLTLGFMTAKPVKSHPDHLDSSLDNGVMDKAGSCRVIGLDRRFRLFPPHFLQGIAQRDHLASCLVEGFKFSLGRRCHHVFYDLGDG